MGQTEEFEVKGEEIVGKVKEFIREGNVRRLTIKDSNGRILLDVPLTLGIVGALFAPFAAAIGMIAALVTEGTVTVTRADEADVESEDAGAE